MARHEGPPSRGWRTFLWSHAHEILACDFFKITTATFRQLTGFVVMDLESRRILAIEVTSRVATGEGAAAVVRRADEAAGETARYLFRDRDGFYGHEFRAVVRAHGLRQLVTAYRASKMNAHCERLIGTLRRECLDHVLVLREGQARRVLEEYAKYYNEARCHQAISGEAPVPRASTGAAGGRLVSRSVLGGLHHVYRRAA